MKQLYRILCIISFIILINYNVKAQKKKNVVFIMADDFNFWLKKIGYYPLVKTPNLDKLAEKGVLFSNAHCSSPVSNPSRNALWSGYRPSTTGIDNNSGGYVRDKANFKNITSFHQYFKEHGYYTYAGGKIWHPGSMGDKHTDPDNWNDLYRGGSGSPGGSYSKWTVPSKSNYSWSGGTFDMHDKANDTKLADHMANKIKNYNKSAQKDKPFFMAIGFFRPHMPWNCHKDFWDQFDRSQIVKPQGYKAGDLKDHDASTQNIHADIVKAGKWEEAIHGYLANLAYADYNVGIVLDAIENSQYADNTIICFMGDHGWNLGEKERWGKYALYDMAHWTSMIIYDPSAEGNGKECVKPVSLQDMYPTLVELTGIEPVTNVEGRSIAPLLYEPEGTDWNWPIMMTYSGKDIIKTNEYRYINAGNKSQLYKVSEDPYEWDNLYGKSGTNAIINSLKAQVDSMKAIGNYLKNNGLKPKAGVPIAYMSSPFNRSVYAEGSAISLTAEAADPSGNISKVEFYAGNTRINSDQTAPYSFNWTNATPGVHTVYIKAFDNNNNVTESVPINIIVQAPGSNIPPSVMVSSPTNGSNIETGQTISIQANAEDVDGSVKSVTLYIDDQLIGSKTASPYKWSYDSKNLSLGDHTVYFIAKDNDNATTKSSTVNFTVKETQTNVITDITDLEVTATCSSVKLTWSDVNGESGYRVRRKIEGEATYTNLGDVAQDAQTYTDKDITEQVTYIYQVRPLDGGTAVAVSNNPKVTIPTCTIKDCAGVEGGSASVDDCGECSGGTTGLEPNASCTDCYGVVNGTATIDDCGECTGGTTGLEPNVTCSDCAGVIGGTASVDDCGECSGGTTGLESNSSCKDCAGIVNGKAFSDECGICSGGETGITPSTFPEVTVTKQDMVCGALGSIELTFPDNTNRTKLEFSIDGGSTFPVNVADDTGTYIFTDLEASDYSVFARWGNDECPIDLGIVSIESAPKPYAEIATENPNCGVSDGKIIASFSDTDGRTELEFSLDSGTSYPVNIKDNTSTYTFENLEVGDYNVFVRWGNNDCPVELGTFTLTETGCPSEITQEVTLQQGWNLFSLYVQNTDKSITDLVSNIDFSVIKSSDNFAQSTYPAHLNTLQEYEIGKGYLLYVNTDNQTISVTGEPVTDFSIESVLTDGWNIIGIGEQAIDVELLPNTIVEIKDFESFWIKGTGGSLTTLLPGKAYFVKVNQ
jgi:arylsulfatase A-like enzyme